MFSLSLIHIYKNVSEKVQALSERLETAKDENEFFDMVTDFYKAYGVGMFGLNKACQMCIRDSQKEWTVRLLDM